MESSRNKLIHLPLFGSVLAAVLCLPILGDDWPVHSHDNLGSGRTGEKLAAAKLREVWVYEAPFPPQPAWDAPARWDAYASIRGLKSLRSYDQAFHTVIAQGRLFFGSSVEDSVHCLDPRTGKRKWSFTANGPIRTAPTFHEGRLYFGADDGFAYCLDAKAGKLLWKFSPNPHHRQVIHNGRMISFWPCRTGVLIESGSAYFANSMLPWKESYLCAVDAVTGKAEGNGRYIRKLDGMTLEGSIIGSAGQLVFPQGRVAPLMVNRADGKPLGGLKGGGGSFVLITPEAQIVHGPGTPKKGGNIITSDPNTRAALASSKGNALIVHGPHAYILSDKSISAINRTEKKVVWKKACSFPFSLILAGDTLFAGGDGVVGAFRASDGKFIWRGRVNGKVFSLAAAEGALFASTDEGAIHCFRPGRKAQTPEPPKPTDKTLAAGLPDAVVVSVNDKDLIGRWVFNRKGVESRKVKDQAGSLAATIVGRGQVRLSGRMQALDLDGSTASALIANNHSKVRVPVRDISAEAWVQVDKPHRWGGIIGAIQDNGDYERGWILGFTDSKFSFAVAGAEANQRLTYLAGKTAFEPRTWYHVVGTYDGQEIRIYVNGSLERTSSVQKGDINYPPQAFYEIGAYHDKNEYYRMSGRISEVRVYQRVLKPEEIQKEYETRKNEFPKIINRIAMGPFLQFTGPSRALVQWETTKPLPTVLEYSLDGLKKIIHDKKPKRKHQATMVGLERNRIYHCLIRNATATEFECDTHFNYSPLEPRMTSSGNLHSDRTADAILKAAGVRKGICIVLGIGDGKLARALARRSKMSVIGTDPEPATVKNARRDALRTGLYGVRLSYRQVRSLEATDFPSDFANLVIITNSTEQGVVDEALRMLQPGRGIGLIGGAGGEGKTILRDFPGSTSLKISGKDYVQLKRAPKANIGEWTHLYGRPDNTAFGGEPLGGAKTADDLEVLWIGRPGPRYQADRNGRKPSPLSINGRLFIQGLERIITIDAHNGTILWSLELPNFRRFNMPRDCSNWCADSESVFAAIGDRCWKIHGQTGRIVQRYPVIGGPKKSWEYDWGYIASEGELLVGSAVKKGTANTDFWGSGGWYDSKAGGVTHKVCSDSLFALYKEDGNTAWIYSKGLIINPTITISDGRVCFIETRNPIVMASNARRLGAPEMWLNQFLVALDLHSGEKLWEKPIDTPDGDVVFYMACGSEVLATVASRRAGKKGLYHINTWDAKTGKEKWQNSFGWSNEGHHGSHMSRPVIVGNTLAVRPNLYNLRTGEPLALKMPGGGCGTYAATTNTFLFRAGTVTMWDHTSGKKSTWSRLRPDCWLSTIPAGGMLLSPEGGGGCSCGVWLETSLAFRPVSRK